MVRLDCLTIDPIENPFNEASALQMLQGGRFGAKPPTVTSVEDVFQVRSEVLGLPGCVVSMAAGVLQAIYWWG